MTTLPFDVRAKLALTGAELSDAEWRDLPRLARQRLIEWGVDQPISRQAYCEFVSWLRDTFLTPPLEGT